CLQSDPTKRPESLVEVLDSVRLSSQEFPRESIPKKPLQEDTIPAPFAPQQLVMQELIEQIMEKPQPEVAVARSTNTEEAVAKETSSFGGLRPIIRTTQIERPTTDPDPAAVFLIDTSVKVYTPERKEVKNVQPLLTDMIVVEGGTFYRG